MRFYPLTAITTYSDTVPSEAGQKKYLDLQLHEWLWPLAALLSLSMIGLSFPLGYLGLAIVMFNRFFKNRYDFLIIFCIWCGNYAFTALDNYKVTQPWNIGLAVSIIGAIFLKWNSATRKTIIALIIYAASLIWLAIQSWETLKVQSIILKTYFFFIYFTLPLLFFANREFNVAYFFRRLFPYMLIICIFYIIDCIIFNGNVLIPNSYLSGGAISRFYDLYWAPFSFQFPRKYPPGLYLLVLIIFPLQQFYKLRTWQWIVIILALLTCRTFSVITALLLSFLLFQKNTRKTAIYLGALIVAMVPVYFVDKAMGVTSNKDESVLRISSSVDQFINLGSAQDDEDLAEFGSGRMAQALPKLALVYEYKKQWTGLGFLHPQYTKNPKLIIFNEYYSDVTKAEESAAGIEVELLQTFVNCGYLGLIVFFIFYGYTCWVIRKYRLAKFYYTVLFAVFWMGMGGFATLSFPHGLIITGLAYGVVLLSEKNEKNQEFTTELVEGKENEP